MEFYILFYTLILSDHFFFFFFAHFLGIIKLIEKWIKHDSHF